MEIVRGDLIFTSTAMSVENGGSQECLLVFRRSDTKKRINICSKRYAFNSQTFYEVIKVLSPAGFRDLKDIKAEIDNDGDIRCLHFDAQMVTFHQVEMSLPATTILFLSIGAPDLTRAWSPPALTTFGRVQPGKGRNRSRAPAARTSSR